MGSNFGVVFSSGLAGFLSFVCIKERRYYKQHGTVPGKTAQYQEAV
jgi:hypothetical protein